MNRSLNSLLILVLAELCSFFIWAHFLWLELWLCHLIWSYLPWKFLREWDLTPLHTSLYSICCLLFQVIFSLSRYCAVAAVFTKSHKGLGPNSSIFILMAWKGAAARGKDSKNRHIHRMMGMGRLGLFQTGGLDCLGTILWLYSWWGSSSGSRGWHAAARHSQIIQLRATSLMWGSAPEWDFFGSVWLWEEPLPHPVQLQRFQEV